MTLSHGDSSAFKDTPIWYPYYTYTRGIYSPGNFPSHPATVAPSPGFSPDHISPARRTRLGRAAQAGPKGAPRPLALSLTKLLVKGG